MLFLMSLKWEISKLTKITDVIFLTFSTALEALLDASGT